MRRFPSARVTVTNEPRVLPGYDVYLIDNRFGQRELALDLCAQTRQVAPEALIIVWSAHVTKELLKELSRVGINAVPGHLFHAKPDGVRTVRFHYAVTEPTLEEVCRRLGTLRPG